MDRSFAVPTEWERRIVQIWLTLSVAWVALFPLALVAFTDQDSLRSWLADPEEPGWIWLVAPPLALGLLLRFAAGISHATLRRSVLYWDDMPGEARRAARPAAPRAAAPADRPRKDGVRERDRVRSPEPARHGRRARR